MKQFVIACVLAVLVGSTIACDIDSADRTQRLQQEVVLKDLTAQTGMPDIKNGRERKLVKEFLELRDQEGFVTYTYAFADGTGKFTFICNSIGLPIPYATQYTNPMKPMWENSTGSPTIPQADPNGLFSPASARASFSMCGIPNSKRLGVMYAESRLTTLPFKLPDSIVLNAADQNAAGK